MSSVPLFDGTQCGTTNRHGARFWPAEVMRTGGWLAPPVKARMARRFRILRRAKPHLTNGVATVKLTSECIPVLSSPRTALLCLWPHQLRAWHLGGIVSALPPLYVAASCFLQGSARAFSLNARLLVRLFA